jgi:Ca2+-binding RTX toxin-like protein
MRRSALLLTSLVLAVLLASGVAWAATINCRASADRCYGTNGSDTINGSGVRDIIYGDALYGTTIDRADIIYGNGGADKISGGAGADDVYGNDDKDVIYGNDGKDTLRGNEDDDEFFGGDEDDVIKGGAGADRVSTTQQILGDDRMYGGPGNDSFSDEVGRNVLSGGLGNDYLYGHSRLVGGKGDDDIVAHARNEETADEGPRGILGGPGNDYVNSQGGTNDTIYVSDGERDTVGCGRGTDTVYFDKGIDKFLDNSGCENRVPR